MKTNMNPQDYNCTQQDLDTYWIHTDIPAHVVREGVILATWQLLKEQPGRHINHLTSAEVKVMRILWIIRDSEK
jgi:hypothetical protein